jgi:hypothetical protein
MRRKGNTIFIKATKLTPFVLQYVAWAQNHGLTVRIVIDLWERHNTQAA